MRNTPRAVLLVAGLVAAAAGVASAQGRPLSARAWQDLSFGQVIRGVPVTVSRFDAAHAGQWEVRARNRAEVQIELTLPGALVAGAGALLPVEFTANDAGYSTSRSFVGSQGFDPHLPITVRLPNNGKAYVFLGGTVRPGTQQAIGRYAASITLTVAYTGN